MSYDSPVLRKYSPDPHVDLTSAAVKDTWILPASGLGSRIHIKHFGFVLDVEAMSSNATDPVIALEVDDVEIATKTLTDGSVLGTEERATMDEFDVTAGQKIELVVKTAASTDGEGHLFIDYQVIPA